MGLYGKNNLFTTLDVSYNPDLKLFHCGGNQLTTLDVSSNTALTVLDCSLNQLTSLDVSNNIHLGTAGWMFIDHNLEGLIISGMPTLEEVCVWELPFPPDGVPVDTMGSPNVYFTTECSK